MPALSNRAATSSKPVHNPTKRPFLWIGLVASVMLALALGNWPYSYYTVLRFVVCAASAYGATIAAGVERRGVMWILGVIAVLFNPLVPFQLTRELWMMVDLAAALILLLAGLSLTRRL